MDILHLQDSQLRNQFTLNYQKLRESYVQNLHFPNLLPENKVGHMLNVPLFNVFA